METQVARIEKDIEKISAFNATPEKGTSRFTFSKEYMGARSYVSHELTQIGVLVSTTIGGNLRGRLEGTEKGTPPVMMGSHIDTVLHGGRFDGVAGVVAALDAARVIVEKKIPHRHPIDVVIFAEEEGSRFGSVMIGSRAWVGKLRPNDLRQFKDKDGVSYVEAMEHAHVVAADDAILRPGAIKAMLELHIEQSVVLEKKGFQLGIVEGIAGIKQFIVTVSGIPNHAGATPMGLRHDALQGAVRIIAAAEEIAAPQRGRNTVVTVGSLVCEPGQVNVIPGKVQFALDIRDSEPNRIDEAVKKIMAVIQKTCQDRGLTFETKLRSDTPPVLLSREMVHLIDKVAREKKFIPLKMTSGALHDSSIIAEVTEVGMIFVPSKDGRSHCPEEFTDSKDIHIGAEILLATVLKLST